MRVFFCFVTSILILISFQYPLHAATISDHIDIGKTKLEKEDYNAAIKQFTKVLELDPSNSVAFNLRGVAKAKRGDFQGSIQDYDQSLKLDSINVDTLNNRGIAKARLGNIDEAIQDFDTAIKTDKIMPVHILTMEYLWI